MEERRTLVGRRSELAAIAGALRGDARLLTLTGPSGMGKTSLARSVLAELSDNFAAKGGAQFVDLSAAEGLGDLEEAVAAALGLPALDGERLTRAIAKRGAALLVLDNLEGVAREGAPIVEAWLREAADLRILVTSLVPLELPEERRIELGPLELSAAVELYLDRARSAGFHDELSSLERGPVEELALRLDCIPLALELAAARIRILPPRALLARISDRFDLLHVDRPGRHGSLLQALAVTWELLSEDEREALAQVSVFAGGFTLEAAQAVLRIGPGPDPGPRTLDALDGLRGKALLQADGGDPPRFSAYESVRQFAGLRLAERGEAAETERRHACALLEQAEANLRAIDGVDAPRVIRWFEAEQENLLAGHRRFTERDPGLSARVGLALSRMLKVRGSRDAELRLLDATVAAARRADRPLLLANALRARGGAHRRMYRSAAAEADLLEALALARSETDFASQGHLLCSLASVLGDTGAFERAEALLEEAEGIVRESGEPLLLGYLHFIRGSVACRAGRFAEGHTRLREALPSFRALGHLRYEGLALLAVGFASSQMGKLPQARQAYTRARALFAQVGAAVYESVAVTNLGGVLRLLGDLEEADRTLGEALRQQERLGDPRLEAAALGNLGLSALEQGDSRRANRHLRQAGEVLHATGRSRLQGVLLAFEGASEALLGRVESARCCLREARDVLDGQPAELEVVDLLEHLVARIEGGRPPPPLPRLSPEGAESRALALRLLERVSGESAGDVQEGDGLVLGEEAAWFALHRSGRVDLRRRALLRRLLVNLVEQHRQYPGEALSVDELGARCWPGESILPEAATNRVRNAVSTLRRLGLSPALRWDGAGYLIDPSLPVRWSGE